MLARGFVIVFDPALTVPGDHVKAQGPLALFHRSRRELLGAAACRRVEPPTAREAVAEWWSKHPPATKRHRQWLSPYRLAVIAGRYTAGQRCAGGAGATNLSDASPHTRTTTHP